jgi:hypothetical protein
MFTENDINGHGLGDLPWKLDRNKWSVARMDGFSKAGLNEIHFDLQHVSGIYRLAIGYGQREEVAEALAALRGRHPELRDDVVDALTYQDFSKGGVLRYARAVRETIEGAGLRRDVAVARPAGRARTPTEGWFTTRAASIIALHGLGDWDVTENAYRTLLGDDRDDLLLVGWSRAAAAAPEGTDLRREHAVPLVLIRDELARRLAAGAGRAEISDLLMSHLGVVVVTAGEQRALDAQWRTTMPPGWEWGGGRLERLHRAGIALE